jgi:hypothetical protein
MKSPPRQCHLLFPVLVATFLATGCHDKIVNNAEQIVGSGEIVTRDVALPPFSGIELTGIGEVYVKQDTSQLVRLEADDNIINRLLIDVHDGNLNIGIQKGSYSNVTIKVHVSMTRVEFLELTGAGNLMAVGPLETDSLSCRIIGAGSMTLSGHASSQTIQLEGVGSVHGFDFVSSRCAVLLSGTGSAEVNVTQRLEATLTGVGSVIYAGNPSEVITHISGLGSVYRK